MHQLVAPQPSSAAELFPVLTEEAFFSLITPFLRQSAGRGLSDGQEQHRNFCSPFIVAAGEETEEGKMLSADPFENNEAGRFLRWEAADGETHAARPPRP